MGKIRKRKYIGGCDTPEPIDDMCSVEGKHSFFPSLPIKLNWDYTPNSAHHLRTQGVFLDYDYPDSGNENYRFKYLLKL